jgi:hypothetical protein
MQGKGLPLVATLRVAFEGGAISGVRQLYAALPPTVVMLGMKQALIFGSGAAVKKKLPERWPEPVRDAASMGFSAFICTSLIFPMDTFKTRMQLGTSWPTPGQWYQGFTPAMGHAIVGRALWMVSRNALEQRLPEPESVSLKYWRHFLCGGITGVIVTGAVFPLDTMKKLLQAAELEKRGLRDTAIELYRDGGLLRFYRGCSVKLIMNFTQGALFNAIFVAVSNSLESLQ